MGQSSVAENAPVSGIGRGRGRGRGGGTSAAIHTEYVEPSYPQARIYALTRQEAQASPDVVTGIISICKHDAYVLIDPGSTCSFISEEFALRVHG